jgi:electron transfer flavoprotein alpha subunit
MFRGKVVAVLAMEGAGPYFLTVQAGAFRADGLSAPAEPPPVRRLAATVEASAIRQRPEAPFREARQDVDLTQATRIVAVGRGLKEASQLAVVQELATALGAELAASRPVCDAGWLPMGRQVGSSGQTVAPQLYVAVGISGAIQHIVGMRGAKTIVAVNQDREAPIFEIADYGIVGDLFEIVPALVAALRA